MGKKSVKKSYLCSIVCTKMLLSNTCNHFDEGCCSCFQLPYSVSTVRFIVLRFVIFCASVWSNLFPCINIFKFWGEWKYMSVNQNYFVHENCVRYFFLELVRMWVLISGDNLIFYCGYGETERDSGTDILLTRRCLLIENHIPKSTSQIITKKHHSHSTIISIPYMTWVLNKLIWYFGSHNNCLPSKFLICRK